MTSSRYLSLLPFLIGFVPSVIHAETDYNYLGKTGYALWDCAAFASLSETEAKHFEELFAKGHEMLHAYVSAGRDGKLTKENTSEVPIGISWYFVGGPSADFSMGYMWAQFSQHAYDETFQEDLEANFDQKKELQAATAANEYRKKNCTLLLGL
ncbi:hypothetical protein BDE40_2060 [Litoreibacter halocynthiae]|uniref:Uncharacterized protein n=1 Tax=Litoreibacter halocynthiae TaxID=1242689 RepID=A0A4R7LKY1_9RHOB|nr:hypothetical protein [Litoreibacter halocynthiae]TDT75332.1 hypothetical protein BDE40_2060 [Litoreibacter halocynthiae]